MDRFNDYLYDGYALSSEREERATFWNNIVENATGFNHSPVIDCPVMIVWRISCQSCMAILMGGTFLEPAIRR